eukprot:gene4640-5082_t
MPLHVASHPLIAHKMTHLRNITTNSYDFRRVLKELTYFLGYEATRGLNLQTEKIRTPMEVDFEGSKLADNVAIVPILRAGLCMADAMLDLMPRATVHHIGMYRAKESLLPIQYYNRLPKNEKCDVAFVVDPCIATANTIHAVVSILKKWGAKKIVVVCAVGSKVGVDRLMELHPDVDLYLGAMDPDLSPTGMILPGIGDAGDRQFRTPHEVQPDLLPNEPLSPIVTVKRLHEEAVEAGSGPTTKKNKH